MRNPIDVLKLLTEKASVKEYQLERLYRNLYNPDFYLLAYKNIAASPGSMTKGADGMSIDNMSMARINKIIGRLYMGWNQTYRRIFFISVSRPEKSAPYLDFLASEGGFYLFTDCQSVEKKAVFSEEIF